MDGIDGTRHVTGVMNDSDALLWTIERDPLLRSPIVAVVVLDRSPDWARLTERLERLTLAVPRLRSVARARPGRMGPPRWVEDDRFELAAHLEHLAAPAPGTLRQVLDLAQRAGSTAFDPERPLWQAQVIDGVDGAAAMVVKVHHAVMDGVGGMSVLAGLLDLEPGGARHPLGAGPKPSAPRPLTERLGDPLRRLDCCARAFGAEAARTLSRPDDQLRRVGATARSVGRLLAPAPAPLSPLLRGRGLDRRFEVLTVDPERLRVAAARVGGTLNDAFVAGVLRGMARYHAHHGQAAGPLRVLMPINIRQGSHPAAGNHFVPARLVLDGSTEPVTELLRHVHQRALEWKRAPALGLSDALAAVLDHLPPPVATAVFGSMLKGDDVVATNVPGPPVETWLAGAHVDALHAFAPTTGAALNAALVTQAGRGSVGINVDAAAASDVDALMDCLRRGLADVAGTRRGPRAAPGTRAHRPRPTGVRS